MADATSTPRTGSRVFVETWGCQMNELDSQRMLGQLMAQGFLPTRDAAQADVILLNSCSIREKAAQKAYSRLGEYRLLKAERPDLTIGFCGCVAEQEGEQALKRVRELDFVVGTGKVGDLAAIVEHQRRTRERTVHVGFPDRRDYDIDTISRDGQYKGMITIIEGCNKRCTFCIVPTTRGPERCRSMAEIVAEAEHLVDYGFVEIELLGQTVNHWREPASGLSGGPSWDFAHLLDRVARVPGVQRLRFVTSYPRDFTPDMVDQFDQHPNLSSSLHLPVQSGSDAVLKRMGRGYSIDSYLDLIRDIRRRRPEIALSTDIIVGFPGESEADFEETLDLIRKLEFASIYAFRYSPRPGTAAVRLQGEPDPEVADRRLQDLFAVQSKIQRSLNQKLVGTTTQVLVTGWSRKPGVQTGRTDCHRIVHFAGQSPLQLGRLTTVRIERATDYSLIGSPVAEAEHSGSDRTSRKALPGRRLDVIP